MNDYMVAILHNIRSMHNVGSIFRTADGAGVEKLYLCGITPSPVDEFNKPRPQVIKVSLGAENTVAWEKCNNTQNIIKKLHGEGYEIVAVEQDTRAVPYMEYKANKKIALIFGNEIEGLSKNILDTADAVVDIPMKGEKESLNVGVAFGIIVFSLI